jgi:hypothetical protein
MWEFSRFIISSDWTEHVGVTVMLQTRIWGYTVRILEDLSDKLTEVFLSLYTQMLGKYVEIRQDHLLRNYFIFTIRDHIVMVSQQFSNISRRLHNNLLRILCQSTIIGIKHTSSDVMPHE